MPFVDCNKAFTGEHTPHQTIRSANRELFFATGIITLPGAGQRAI